MTKRWINVYRWLKCKQHTYTGPRDDSCHRQERPVWYKNSTHYSELLSDLKLTNCIFLKHFIWYFQIIVNHWWLKLQEVKPQMKVCCIFAYTLQNSSAFLKSFGSSDRCEPLQKKNQHLDFYITDIVWYWVLSTSFVILP